jgi:hypothetical protein
MTNNLLKFHSQPGFVILFTILISAIIFSMGLGIYSIAIRQTVLSSTAREATQAFYSADAGIECALLAESTQQITSAANNAPGSVTCNNQTITITGTGIAGEIEPFQVRIGSGARNLCANINVFTNVSSRRLIAQGFNGDCPSGGTINPRLVERDLDVTYGI